MDKLFSRIINCEIGRLGRGAIILIAATALFVFSHYVCYPRFLKPDAWLISQLFIGAVTLALAFGCLLILWAIVSFILMVFFWFIHGSTYDAGIFFSEVFYSPAWGGLFILKLMFGSWRVKNV